MHLVNKRYLVHENKHNATLEYINIYIYIGIFQKVSHCTAFFIIGFLGVYI